MAIDCLQLFPGQALALWLVWLADQQTMTAQRIRDVAQNDERHPESKDFVLRMAEQVFYRGNAVMIERFNRLRAEADAPERMTHGTTMISTSPANPGRGGHTHISA
jgi:hypothetical protein